MNYNLLMPLEDYLTVDEVSERTGYHRDAVTRAIRSGRLKGSKMGGRWFVHKTDLAAYQSLPKYPGRPKENN